MAENTQKFPGREKSSPVGSLAEKSEKSPVGKNFPGREESLLGGEKFAPNKLDNKLEIILIHKRKTKLADALACVIK